MIEHADLADALSKGPPSPGNLAVPILAYGSLEVKLYTPTGTDARTPHARDEVYLGARGDGALVEGVFSALTRCLHDF